MYKVKIKKITTPATPPLKEGEKLSRPQTESERAKFIKGGKYVYHLGKRG